MLARLYHGRNRIHGKGVRVPKTFPADDLAWLEEVGLAPNQRTTLHHAKVVRTIIEAKERVSIADGACGFMASLGEGPPHGVLLEAALMAHRLPPHRRICGGSCRVCMMSATATIDLDADENQCPACGEAWGAVPQRCPGCGLRIGPG